MPSTPEDTDGAEPGDRANDHASIELHVRRMHGRDINRVRQFLKIVFRGVNRETVEFQRPRHKQRFIETYEDDGVEQLLFEIKRGQKSELVGYAEYSYEIAGADSWMNHRYFENRGMRPLFVEEINGGIMMPGAFRRSRRDVLADRATVPRFPAFPRHAGRSGPRSWVSRHR
jgi:hypothetical protein